MTHPARTIAILPVREGLLPSGALEAVTEAGGTALVIGSAVRSTLEELEAYVDAVIWAEVGSFAPATWARALALNLAEMRAVVLPASPDGRDLAPHIAAALEWPLIAGAVEVHQSTVVVARHGGLVLETLLIDAPFVATVVPGVIEPAERAGNVHTSFLDLELAFQTDGHHLDTESLGVTEPDASSLDLSESKRIIAGGAGLQSAAAFQQLKEAGAAIEASVGGTRVVMDKGWIDFDRQIGTTGVMVNPDLYIALGISGAVQHTAGLGEPDHIISVNNDPYCPMMAMADLALVTDAPQFLTEFLRLTKQL